MKKLVLNLIFGILATHLFADDVATGLWKSIDEKSGKTTGIWRLYETNDQTLQGEMLLAVAYGDDEICKKCKTDYKHFPLKLSAPVPLLNTPFIYGMKKQSAGSWDDGYIVDPKSGKLYYCELEFDPADGKKHTIDRLKVRGEIGLGIGRSQYWLRSSEAELAKLRKDNPAAIAKREAAGQE